MRRLGVVSYLNARPLIDGLNAQRGIELTFDVPGLLPGRLARGEVDVALIPIVDVLRSAGRYRVLSDACIGCDGETMTVRVFSQLPPDRVRRIWVDGDSHTSVALAAVLWRELFGVTPMLQPFDARQAAPDSFEAVLLIGDKVVDPRRGQFAYEVDLGGAWRAHMGLPFVFAVWARGAGEGLAAADSHVPDAAPGRAGLPRTEDFADRDLSEILGAARDRGVARAAEIARTQGPALGWPVELAERYLTRCLKFTLTPRMIEGAERFASLCRESGLVPADSELSWDAGMLAGLGK